MRTHQFFKGAVYMIVKTNAPIIYPVIFIFIIIITKGSDLLERAFPFFSGKNPYFHFTNEKSWTEKDRM